MHKRNVIAILLTAVIFISAAVLGVSAVYRVNAVTLDASVVSEAAKAEADELQKLLLERYKDESVFFVKPEEAEADFAGFPYFRMTAFKKAYPNRLIVSAKEDPEVFAVKHAEEYYILGADGTVLGLRGEPSNRSDGADNVIVTGISAAGAKGELLGGDECIPSFLAFCSKMSQLLDGLRSNVLSAEVSRRASAQTEMFFSFVFREGIRAEIKNPMALTEKKAEALVSCYLSRPDNEKLGGLIRVMDDNEAPDGVRATYDQNA